MCLTYRKIRHVPAKDNGSRLFAYAPCGYCEDCRNRSRYAWAWRLTSDVQYYVQEKGYKVGFITLTYDDAHLPRFDPYILASDGETLLESPLANEPCFSRKDTESLILYLRKVLHRETGMTGLLYFLASEYGPATQRPHYHMLIAWPSHCEKKVKVHGNDVIYGYDVSAEQMHGLIKHYWCEYKKLGFISPNFPQGGESMKSGKTYKPFEVKSVADCLNTAFYTAKYVTKDLYYMDNLSRKLHDFKDQRIAELELWKEETLISNGGVIDDLVKSIDGKLDYWRNGFFGDFFSRKSVKDCLPHHRQTKSLGFESVRSLSDLEKVNLLNRGKWMLGNDKFSLPPMYIKNKLMFKPCYWIDSKGKRLVKQECTEFFKRNFELIMEKKVEYFDTLFDQMKDSNYWWQSGLSMRDSETISIFVQNAPDLGMKLSEAYIYYFGVPPEHCYVDKKFTLINRYRFPCPVVPGRSRISLELWTKIKDFFSFVMEYAKWKVESVPDHDANYVKDLLSQPLSA